MDAPYDQNTHTKLIIYERLLFELKLLNDELNKHIESSSFQLNDMNNLLRNSQKYYYIIMLHLYQGNI